jgi:hypothetical protein
MSLMICYNAIPVSSLVFKNRFNIAMNSSWVFCFCLRVLSAFARRCDARVWWVDARDAAGASHGARAKESLQLLQR